MGQYRVFMLTEAGSYKGAKVLECDNDDQAVDQARKFVDGCDVELWQGARMIATLKRPHHGG